MWIFLEVLEIMSGNFTDEMELIAARIISASWTVLPNSLPLKKLNLMDC
jgi:hypothetical protein